MTSVNRMEKTPAMPDPAHITVDAWQNEEQRITAAARLEQGNRTQVHGASRRIPLCAPRSRLYCNGTRRLVFILVISIAAICIAFGATGLIMLHKRKVAQQAALEKREFGDIGLFSGEIGSGPVFGACTDNPTLCLVCETKEYHSQTKDTYAYSGPDCVWLDRKTVEKRGFHVSCNPLTPECQAFNDDVELTLSKDVQKREDPADKKAPTIPVEVVSDICDMDPDLCRYCLSGKIPADHTPHFSPFISGRICEYVLEAFVSGMVQKSNIMELPSPDMKHEVSEHHVVADSLTDDIPEVCEVNPILCKFCLTGQAPEDPEVTGARAKFTYLCEPILFAWAKGIIHRPAIFKAAADHLEEPEDVKKRQLVAPLLPPHSAFHQDGSVIESAVSHHRSDLQEHQPTNTKVARSPVEAARSEHSDLAGKGDCSIMFYDSVLGNCE